MTLSFTLTACLARLLLPQSIQWNIGSTTSRRTFNGGMAAFDARLAWLSTLVVRGCVPLTVLAARQPMHGAYVDVLVALACVHADFDEQDTNTGETASTILNTRGPPGFYLQYLRERAHAINSGADAAFE